MRRAEGVRWKAAELTGYSPRGLRDLLNKYPELKKRYEYSTSHGEDAYQQRKLSFLAATPQYWLPSRREYVVKELTAIAKLNRHSRHRSASRDRYCGSQSSFVAHRSIVGVLGCLCCSLARLAGNFAAETRLRAARQ